MITVCIATYNGSRYIRQQLLSILPQLAETDEIVVSDDGSTDDTSEIVRSIGDKRIRLWITAKEKVENIITRKKMESIVTRKKVEKTPSATV